MCAAPHRGSAPPWQQEMAAQRGRQAEASIYTCGRQRGALLQQTEQGQVVVLTPPVHSNNQQSARTQQ